MEDNSINVDNFIWHIMKGLGYMATGTTKVMSITMKKFISDMASILWENREILYGALVKAPMIGVENLLKNGGISAVSDELKSYFEYKTDKNADFKNYKGSTKYYDFLEELFGETLNKSPDFVEKKLIELRDLDTIMNTNYDLKNKTTYAQDYKNRWVTRENPTVKPWLRDILMNPWKYKDGGEYVDILDPNSIIKFRKIKESEDAAKYSRQGGWKNNMMEKLLNVSTLGYYNKINKHWETIYDNFKNENDEYNQDLYNKYITSKYTNLVKSTGDISHLGNLNKLLGPVNFYKYWAKAEFDKQKEMNRKAKIAKENIDKIKNEEERNTSMKSNIYNIDLSKYDKSFRQDYALDRMKTLEGWGGFNKSSELYLQGIKDGNKRNPLYEQNVNIISELYPERIKYFNGEKLSSYKNFQEFPKYNKLKKFKPNMEVHPVGVPNNGVVLYSDGHSENEKINSNIYKNQIQNIEKSMSGAMSLAPKNNLKKDLINVKNVIYDKRVDDLKKDMTIGKFISNTAKELYNIVTTDKDVYSKYSPLQWGLLAKEYLEGSKDAGDVAGELFQNDKDAYNFIASFNDSNSLNNAQAVLEGIRNGTNIARPQTVTNNQNIITKGELAKPGPNPIRDAMNPDGTFKWPTYIPPINNPIDSMDNNKIEIEEIKKDNDVGKMEEEEKKVNNIPIANPAVESKWARIKKVLKMISNLGGSEILGVPLVEIAGLIGAAYGAYEFANYTSEYFNRYVEWPSDDDPDFEKIKLQIEYEQKVKEDLYLSQLHAWQYHGLLTPNQGYDDDLDKNFLANIPVDDDLAKSHPGYGGGMYDNTLTTVLENPQNIYNPLTEKTYWRLTRQEGSPYDILQKYSASSITNFMDEFPGDYYTGTAAPINVGSYTSVNHWEYNRATNVYELVIARPTPADTRIIIRTINDPYAFRKHLNDAVDPSIGEFGQTSSFGGVSGIRNNESIIVENNRVINIGNGLSQKPNSHISSTADNDSNIIEKQPPVVNKGFFNTIDNVANKLLFLNTGVGAFDMGKTFPKPEGGWTTTGDGITDIDMGGSIIDASAQVLIPYITQLIYGGGMEITKNLFSKYAGDALKKGFQNSGNPFVDSNIYNNQFPVFEKPNDEILQLGGSNPEDSRSTQILNAMRELNSITATDPEAYSKIAKILGFIDGEHIIDDNERRIWKNTPFVGSLSKALMHGQSEFDIPRRYMGENQLSSEFLSTPETRKLIKQTDFSSNFQIRKVLWNVFKNNQFNNVVNLKEDINSKALFLKAVNTKIELVKSEIANSDKSHISEVLTKINNIVNTRDPMEYWYVLQRASPELAAYVDRILTKSNFMSGYPSSSWANTLDNNRLEDLWFRLINSKGPSNKFKEKALPMTGTGSITTINNKIATGSIKKIINILTNDAVNMKKMKIETVKSNNIQELPPIEAFMPTINEQLKLYASDTFERVENKITNTATKKIMNIGNPTTINYDSNIELNSEEEEENDKPTLNLRLPSMLAYKLVEIASYIITNGDATKPWIIDIDKVLTIWDKIKSLSNSSISLISDNIPKIISTLNEEVNEKRINNKIESLKYDEKKKIYDSYMRSAFTAIFRMASDHFQKKFSEISKNIEDGISDISEKAKKTYNFLNTPNNVAKYRYKYEKEEFWNNVGPDSHLHYNYYENQKKDKWNKGKKHAEYMLKKDVSEIGTIEGPKEESFTDKIKKYADIGYVKDRYKAWRGLQYYPDMLAEKVRTGLKKSVNALKYADSEMHNWARHNYEEDEFLNKVNINSHLHPQYYENQKRKWWDAGKKHKNEILMNKQGTIYEGPKEGSFIDKTKNFVDSGIKNTKSYIDGAMNYAYTGIKNTKPYIDGAMKYAHTGIKNTKPYIDGVMKYAHTGIKKTVDALKYVKSELSKHSEEEKMINNDYIDNFLFPKYYDINEDPIKTYITASSLLTETEEELEKYVEKMKAIRRLKKEDKSEDKDDTKPLFNYDDIWNRVLSIAKDTIPKYIKKLFKNDKDEDEKKKKKKDDEEPGDRPSYDDTRYDDHYGYGDYQIFNYKPVYSTRQLIEIKKKRKLLRNKLIKKELEEIIKFYNLNN